MGELPSSDVRCAGLDLEGEDEEAGGGVVTRSAILLALLVWLVLMLPLVLWGVGR